MKYSYIDLSLSTLNRIKSTSNNTKGTPLSKPGNRVLLATLPYSVCPGMATQNK